MQQAAPQHGAADSEQLGEWEYPALRVHIDWHGG